MIITISRKWTGHRRKGHFLFSRSAVFMEQATNELSFQCRWFTIIIAQIDY